MLPDSQCEGLARHRRAGNVAAQPFEPPPGLARGGDARVQGEAGVLGDRRTVL